MVGWGWVVESAENKANSALLELRLGLNWQEIDIFKAQCRGDGESALLLCSSG